MRVLLTGAGGQVGAAVAAAVPPGVECHCLRHAELDIGDGDRVNEVITAIGPDVIINAAAYTAVDKAESERELAVRVNAEGPRNLAHAARAQAGCRLIHISTDFVFGGDASRPYGRFATPSPLGVYGSTKLAGERDVGTLLPQASVILRTAWVYAATGHNFLRTMLRLMRERGRVSVVADQMGTPTAAASVAAVLWALAARPDVYGPYHWTDAGAASWYDFAVAIAEEASAIGLLRGHVEVIPIATQDYPTPATRPAYSVLDSRETASALGVQRIHWRVRLREVLKEMVGA